jgi:hypothetical protein
MERGIYAQQVRDHARAQYIEPARRRGDSVVKIVAGEVVKAVHLHNRTPLVCQALRSHKFQKENHIVLEKWEGPPKGMSTTVTFTYRLIGDSTRSSVPDGLDAFLKLRGTLKDVFQSLGGGEEFIRRERENFYGPGKDS